MITCNRCGNVAPAGAVQCQRCGAPLSSKGENTTYNKGMMGGGQEQGGQAELPAWLESLRVGERPPAPAKSPSSFSAKDLIEEGSLPGWMRPEQSSGNQPVPPSPAPAALRPASFPGPNTDANMNASTNESTLAAKGFAARSLIDEQALPNWMKDGGSGKSGPITGGATETPAPGNMAASSLVQPDALPDWMKNLQPPSSSPARPAQPSGYPGPNATAHNTSGLYAAPQSVTPPATPVVPSTPPSQPLQSTQPAAQSGLSAGFSARDLVDQNSLPAWMNPQGGAQTGAVPNNSGPVAPSQPVQPGQSGFSAHDLIDQSSLPAWMNPQGGAQTGAAPNNSGPAAPSQPAQPGQAGFSASSLLDMDSLPSWLKESGQQQKGGSAPAQPAQGWQSGSFPTPGTPPQQNNMPWQGAAPAGNAVGNGISAASFIDQDALPSWLKESGQQAPTGGNRPGAHTGGPQRVENMRVPSRPRGEINPSVGESELAANVFASMLGVASAAPNFPASSAPSMPPAPPQPQPSPRPTAQPGGYPPLSGPPSMAGAPAGGVMPQQPVRPPAPNNVPGMPQPAAGNQQPVQGYLGVYGGAQPGMQNSPNPYAMGNPPMGSPQIPASGPGMPPVPNAAAGQTGDGQSDVKQAKRGLFNSIREWFFR